MSRGPLDTADGVSASRLDEPASDQESAGAAPRRRVTPFAATWGLVRRHQWATEVVAVVVLSSAMVASVFRWDIDRLRAVLGYGDLLAAYSMTSMWSNGNPLGDTSLGYPTGMHLPYFPTADTLPNLLAALFSQFTVEPFLPLNLVFAVSFPMTAVAALWVLKLTGTRGPLAVVGALGLTAIPYHWLRVEHIYLSTMYSAVLGVGLALLVGTGAASRAVRTRDLKALLTMAAVAVLVGTGGIYYACFAIMLIAVAALYRAFLRDSWPDVLLSLIPALATVAALGAALLPGAIWSRAHPAIGEVATRAPVESVEYSGALTFAVLPGPTSDLPGTGFITRFVEDAYQQGRVIDTSGVLWNANSGSFFTAALLLAAFVGALVAARRGVLHPVTTSRPNDVSLGLALSLMATTLLFFVPWGANYLFALVVTPQLRGWDRLIPVLFTLVLVVTAVIWRTLVARAMGWRAWAVAALGLVVIVGDSVTPYRAVFDEWSTNGLAERQHGLAYAEQLNAAIPGSCGVLQLPYVPFPEVPPVEALSAYGHALPALTNPEKSWSFGAVKDTQDSRWVEALGDDVSAADVAALKEAGFCAIHVDWRGYVEPRASELAAHLEGEFGAPVAVGHDGHWSAFALAEG